MSRMLVVVITALGVVVGGFMSAPDAMARVRSGLSFVVWEQPGLDGEDWEALKPWRSMSGLNRNECHAEVITAIDDDWDADSPGACHHEDFLARYSGYITAPRSGMYTFYASVDDGVWLKIGRRVVFSDWADQGMETYNVDGSVRLRARVRYPLEAWMYENAGGAGFRLYYSVGNSDPALVPRSWFSH